MSRFSPLRAICDREVVDPDGEPIGRIHDILLDLREGRIEYICIALEDPAAGTESLEAIVPWSALREALGDSGAWRVAAGKSLLQKIARPMLPRD